MPDPTTDLTDWATDMADAGLQPYDGTLTLDSGGKPFARLHLAFAEGMDNADREGFLLKLGQVVLKNL